MTRQCGTTFDFQATLWCCFILSLCWSSKYETAGAPRKYGTKINYGNIPAQYLKASSIEDGMRKDIYQLIMLHKDFRSNTQCGNYRQNWPEKLGSAGMWSYSVVTWNCLLSNWLIIIAFVFRSNLNFRDAQAILGSGRFSWTSQKTAVTNAANLSLFMVNVSHLLLRDFRRNRLSGLWAPLIWKRIFEDVNMSQKTLKITSRNARTYF